MALINGTNGNDQFASSLFSNLGQDDQVFGFGGDDWIWSSSGADSYDGGAGQDLVFYESPTFTNGVTVNLTSSTVAGVAAGTADTRGFGTHTLTSIENLHGSQASDQLYFGSFTGSYSFDRGGDDLVVANQDPNAFSHYFAVGSGSDTYVGSLDDSDTLAFDGGNDGSDVLGRITSGVTVTFTSIGSGTAIDGWGFTDTFSQIEDIQGTGFDDTVLGSAGNEQFSGLGGNDTLRGFGGNDRLRGGAGNDILDGGAGEDRVVYSGEIAQGGTQGVDVDLAAGTAIDAFGDTDTLIDIERADGTDLSDTLRGTDVFNSLYGGDGDDFLFGRGGSDDLLGGRGNDTLDGGTGDDEVEYNNESGTNGIVVNLVTGIATDTYGDTDTLISIEDVRGSDNDDTITGDGGDNRLRGRDGADTLNGGGGDDRIGGGQGNDTIDGGTGQDRVLYGFDHDTAGGSGIVADLTTGTVTDTYGTIDTLTSIEGVEGSVFDDIITGDAGDNNLQGDDGDDTITGGAGDDFISGDVGNDTLISGDGNDSIDGGDGDDTFDLTGQTDTFGGFNRPGLGNNTLMGSATMWASFGEGHDLSYDDLSGVGGVILSVGDNGTGTARSGTAGLMSDTFSYFHFFYGSADDDSFTSTSTENRFQGWAGNGGDDIIDGGAGFDAIDYRWEYFQHQSTAQAVTVDLAAGTATDTYGNTDTLIGIDAIRGTMLNDTFSGDASLGFVQYRGYAGDDTINGTSGFDEADYSGDARDGGDLGITANLAQGTIVDGYGDTDTVALIDSVRGTGSGDVMTAAGTSADIRFRGEAGSDRLTGGNGNDDLSGGTDADTLAGGAGNDFMRANQGMDTSFGGLGDDVLRGGYGRDTLNGGDGNDTLRGGGNADTLIGGAGDDQLWGGRGDDMLTGGSGADVFVFWGPAGSDTITDFVDGTDLIDLRLYGLSGFSAISGAISSSAGDAILDLAAIGGMGVLTLTGAAGQLDTGDFVFA